MPIVRARYEVRVQPVTISWRQELVDDEDAGDFYVKLVPTVNVTEGAKPTKPGVGWELSVIRHQQAEQRKRIAKQINDETLRHVQNKLKAEKNRRRGQRWNKKV